MAEEKIQAALAGSGSIPDSLAFAEQHKLDHAALIGVCKSLTSGGFIETQDMKRDVLQLTK